MLLVTEANKIHLPQTFMPKVEERLEEGDCVHSRLPWDHRGELPLSPQTKWTCPSPHKQSIIKGFHDTE